ncbi:MAG: hypothetical protein H6576_16365 [Lewinellaceae bacterium]|nr:hypothetical protein [Saprospiraceae bacterium]MCB9345263.1 hypothetical protein [Lewinellaceae bacterium]
MSKKEFYIGWQGKMPENTRKFLKRFLWIAMALIVVMAIGLVFFEKPFKKHFFNFGQLDQITGVYYDEPYPFILTDYNAESGQAKTVLLVGSGKFGAKGIMDKIQDKSGALSGIRITLEGTLISGDGKTLLELTNGTDALKEMLNVELIETPAPPAPENVTLQGEILDPKCYFGVMKPGEGKIHKSCAIRCISGGIPPVFRASEGDSQDERYRYYLLLDQKGNPCNKEILPFVGEPISLQAISTKMLDWDVLFVNIKDIKTQ